MMVKAHVASIYHSRDGTQFLAGLVAQGFVRADENGQTIGIDSRTVANLG
jgi:hypothetical protein